MSLSLHKFTCAANDTQVDLSAGLGTGVQRDSFGFSSHHSVGVRRSAGTPVNTEVPL